MPAPRGATLADLFVRNTGLAVRHPFAKSLSSCHQRIVPLPLNQGQSRRASRDRIKAPLIVSAHTSGMANFNLPSHLSGISPIILTSPTTRCGTTLLQRLFLSSQNAICYGEDIGTNLNMMTTILMNQLTAIGELKDDLNAQREAILAGNTDNWTPNVMPDADGYLNCWIEMYYSMPRFLQTYSESINRPVWLYKYPGIEPTTIGAIRSLFPESKVLFVFRHLEDALKSAKARQFITTLDEMAEYCMQWRHNMLEISDRSADENILFVKYEDMVAQPDLHVTMLEAFTGASGIDPAVFGTKVNTFAGDESEGRSNTQYIDPKALTEEECELMERIAGHVIAQLYPTNRSADIVDEEQASVSN